MARGLFLFLVLAAPAAAQDPLPANWGGPPGTTARLADPSGALEAVRGVWTPAGWLSRFKNGALELDVPATAPIGLVPICAITDAGLGELHLFSIDPYPELDADPKAARPADAQTLPVPCVVAGAILPESARYFRVPLKKGVPLVLDAFGKRLGSPLDPALTLTDPAGRFLPGALADDTPGLGGDARLVYTPPADGFAVAELRDATFQGGAGHHFRLRVGHDVPPIGVVPAALQRENGAVRPVWPDGTTNKGREVVALGESLEFSFRGEWPLAVPLSDDPQVVETEPNDAPGEAQRLPGACGVTAEFRLRRDRDRFTFAAKKGEDWRVVARTAEIGSACEVSVKVVDAAGKVLAQSDPAKKLPAADFAAPADGDVTAICESLNGVAGPRERYWLTVRRGPDFGLALPDPRVTATAGGANLLAVDVDRLGGAGAPIRLSATGKLRGELTVPPGVGGRAWLPVRADATVGAGNLRVVGRAGETRHWAVAEAPLDYYATAATLVMPGPIAELAVAPVLYPVKPGDKFRVHTMLKRQAGVKSPLALTVEEPFRVVIPGPLAADRSVVELALDKAAKPGTTCLGWRLAGPDGRAVSAGAEWVIVAGPSQSKP